MTRRLRAIALFWWDFVVGDDPAIAAGVVVMLGACALLVHARLPAWWLPPASTALVLVLSATRARSRHRASRGSDEGMTRR